MKKFRPFVLFILLLAMLGGCSFKTGIKIDRGTVEVRQGKSDGEDISISFHAELTDTVPAVAMVHWNRGDGKFHAEGDAHDGVVLIYEVFNPFGELELKTRKDGTGWTPSVLMGLPVFSTPENPYEYTLKVTLYLFSRKEDVFFGHFTLTAPEAE